MSHRQVLGPLLMQGAEICTYSTYTVVLGNLEKFHQLKNHAHVIFLIALCDLFCPFISCSIAHPLISLAQDLLLASVVQQP